MIPAVTQQGGRVQRRHLFWYKSRADLDLLYRDYRLFVARTGNNPPLKVVECNILELARRVLALQSRAAVRIQRLLRGALGRVLASDLAAERARLFGVRVCAAILVQRFFRQRLARRAAFRARQQRLGTMILKDLRVEQQQVRQQRLDSVMKASSLLHYRHEAQSAVTGAYTGTPPLTYILTWLISADRLCSHRLLATRQVALRHEPRTASRSDGTGRVLPSLPVGSPNKPS